MSLDFPEVKPDTLEEIFATKVRVLDMNHFNIYHFEEIVFDDRKYLYRLSTKEDLMTVVCQIKGKYYLLVSVFTSMDHKKRLKEINDYILDKESNTNFPDVDYAVFLRPLESSQSINNGSENLQSLPLPIL